MPMEENEIKQLIKDSFADAEVIITDLKGDGDHFAIHIISSFTLLTIIISLEIVKL